MSKLKSIFWSAVFTVAVLGIACRDVLLGLLGLKKKETPVDEPAVPAPVVEAAAEVAAAQAERAEVLEEKKDAVEEKAEELKAADPVEVGNEIIQRRRARAAAKPPARTARAAPARKPRKR